MSDGSRLSNLAADKDQWPVNMSIGNLSSKIRERASMHTFVMVDLLPIPILTTEIPCKRRDMW